MGPINQGSSPGGRVTFDGLDDWGVHGFAGRNFRVTDEALLALVNGGEANRDRTIDLPMDEAWKLSAGYVWACPRQE